jgi:hypothetical protein
MRPLPFLSEGDLGDLGDMGRLDFDEICRSRLIHGGCRRGWPLGDRLNQAGRDRSLDHGELRDHLDGHQTTGTRRSDREDLKDISLTETLVKGKFHTSRGSPRLLVENGVTGEVMLLFGI